ncbi:MAG TPA: response regulator transcription factor [Candidatus Obscuribacterales bacterium]
MYRVLLVEPEKGLSLIFQELLVRESYFVTCATSEYDARVALNHDIFDIIIIDLMVGNRDVLNLCRLFRDRHGSTPILVLSGHACVDEAEAFLDAGADEYLPRSIHLRELTAHIRSMLRRPQINTDNLLIWKDVLVNPTSGMVTKGGKIVHIQPLELDLLVFLMRHQNQTFTAEALWERLWRNRSDSLIDTVRTHIKTLRHKLDDAEGPSIITTFRGRGYMIGTYSEEWKERRPVVQSGAP